jgi:ribosome maturation factor RimP
MKKTDPAPGGEDKAGLVVRQVWDLTEPVVRAEGMEIIEIEYRRESVGWVLRMYVDRDEGVSVDDCARISRVVGDLLDVADIIYNPYHLEVSSPGLDRPLRKREHFAKCIGKVVEIKTLLPLVTRRNFKGILKDVGTGEVTVECDNQLFEIPFSNMDRARLRYFDSQGD